MSSAAAVTSEEGVVWWLMSADQVEGRGAAEVAAKYFNKAPENIIY